MKTAIVFGGTGFVGRYVVQNLLEHGYAVIIPTRTPEKAAFLKPLGNMGQVVPIYANINDEKTLETLLQGADTVVNLIGILYERGKSTFEAVHHQFPRRLSRAAIKAGVKNFVHVSALGANAHSRSQYAKSKAAGEAAVLQEFPSAVILRPSVIFGAEDGFFNLFAKMATLSPFLPLIGGGKTKFQPVFVGDVAKAVVAVLASKTAAGQVFELGGATVYSFKEILQKVLRTTGRHNCLLPLPFFMASIQGFFLQNVPFIKPLLTVDQVRLLKTDNVVQENARTFATLGIVPTAVESVLPSQLKNQSLKIFEK